MGLQPQPALTWFLISTEIYFLSLGLDVLGTALLLGEDCMTLLLICYFYENVLPNKVLLPLSYYLYLP